MKIKKSSKGQIAIFVIISIIIILTGSISFYLYQQFKIKKESETIVISVKEALKNCIKEEAIDGLFILGFQGGYYNISSTNIPNVFIQGFNIPYYYFNNTFYIPSKKEIATNLEKYTSANINCDFRNITESLDISITTFQIRKINITLDKEISIFSDLVLKIHHKEKIYFINSIEISIPFNFNKIYSTIEKITYKSVKIIESNLTEIQKNLEIISINQKDYLFMLSFQNNIRPYPLYWVFIIEQKISFEEKIKKYF